MKKETLPRTFPPFLWHFVKKQWVVFLLIQIFAFGWAIDQTAWPYIIMLLIDTITNYTGDKAHAWAALALPIWLGGILWIVLEVFFRFSGILLARALPRIEADMRMAMFDYVQHHSYSYFSNHFAGAISNKINDMAQGVSRILQLIIQLFMPVALALLIASLMFYQINAWFALILVGWVALHMLVSLSFSNQCAHYSDIHSEARSTLSGKIVDALANSGNIRLFARYRYEYNYLGTYQKEEQQLHMKSLQYVEKMKLAMGIVSFLGAGVAMNWYMLSSWVNGNLSAGELVLVFNTTWNIMMMVWFASLELPNLYRDIGMCKQALSVINDEHDIQDEPEAKQLTVTKGEIEFQNVTFHYLPDHRLFENKNIKIQAGEKVGLVGFSGSGKSTFVHLILRYFDVESGRILIDGQDISQVTQDSLRQSIAFIPQDASLFHRTLLENIIYGRLDATEHEIKEASEQAHCNDFVSRMPEGYETLVGERGMRLSGGQRQRISIARAILKNAPILILDEATSALDSLTEKYIQDALAQLMEGRTSIIIAHRLSTLSGMDRILVFDQGHIVEQGTHAELIAKEDGHYAMLWQMQAGGFIVDENE